MNFFLCYTYMEEHLNFFVSLSILQDVFLTKQQIVSGPAEQSDPSDPCSSTSQQVLSLPTNTFPSLSFSSILPASSSFASLFQNIYYVLRSQRISRGIMCTEYFFRWWGLKKQYVILKWNGIVIKQPPFLSSTESQHQASVILVVGMDICTTLTTYISKKILF